MEFNYYYGNQADQFTFVRIPKVMLTDKKFTDLSIQAKMLYGVLLDRMGLSMKNGWLDDENRVYIIYQISEIQEDLGFSKKKSIDYLAELEAFGLVEKRRRGLGLSNIIYVKSFMTGTSRSVEMGTSEKTDDDTDTDDIDGKNVDKSSNAGNTVPKAKKKTHITAAKSKKSSRSAEVGTSRSVDMGTSGSTQIALQEVTKSTPLEVPSGAPLKSNNNINNTECNNIKSNQIISLSFGEARADKPIRCDRDEMDAYSEIIKENIEFDALLQRYPYEQELVQGIFDLILETVLTKGDTVLISSNSYPTQLVKSKFLKLNFSHIEYVIGCMSKNTTKVLNIKKYLLASLFNAPSTIDGYYKAEVNHDFPQYAH